MHSYLLINEGERRIPCICSSRRSLIVASVDKCSHGVALKSYNYTQHYDLTLVHLKEWAPVIHGSPCSTKGWPVFVIGIVIRKWEGSGRGGKGRGGGLFPLFNQDLSFCGQCECSLVAGDVRIGSPVPALLPVGHPRLERPAEELD